MNPFGSIIAFDLTRLARRGRTFLPRCGYALLLLFVMNLNYESNIRTAYFQRSGNQYTYLSRFAEHFFQSFLVLQFVFIFVMTPVFVGGAIAEEKQRKTLTFLLTTPLSDLEIILAKLASRLGHVTLFLLTGLPVIALLQLFGGVDPSLMWGGFGMTLTTMLAIGGIGMYHSTTAPKPSDAIFRTYLTMMLILVVGGLGSAWVAHNYLPPLSTAVVCSLIAGTELLLTAFYLFRAVRRLRPGSSAEVVQAPAAAATKPLRRRWARPRLPVSDNPMMWLELRVRQKVGRFHWIIWLMALTSFAGVIALIFIVVTAGFGASFSRIDAEAINVLIRIVGTILAIATILGVASEAANGVWLERDKQLLDSLLVTPLTTREILNAKWWGALANPRALYAMLAMLWGFGVAAGGLHIMAIPFVTMLMVVYVCFAASLGMVIGLRAGSRAKAQFWTTLTVAILGTGGPCSCLMGGYLDEHTFFLPPVGSLVACQFYERDFDRWRPYMVLIGFLIVFYPGIFGIAGWRLWSDALKRFRDKYRRVGSPHFAGGRLGERL